MIETWSSWNYEGWTDWNYVHGIQFSFGKHVGADNIAAHRLLNAVYTQTLTGITSLFTIANNGAETLKSDPIGIIKFIAVAAIIDNLPEYEISEEYKEHISFLFANSTIWYINKGTTQPVRDKLALASAANAAKLN
eukprot:jgi/Psemu1/1862/gm1.1862_g